MKQKHDAGSAREYHRLLLRNAVSSLIHVVIGERRKRTDGVLRNLAVSLGKDKGQVSRWLNSDPNWRLDTVADMGDALGVDVQIRARDRKTGQIFTPSGPLPTTEAIMLAVSVDQHQIGSGTRTEVVISTREPMRMGAV